MRPRITTQVSQNLRPIYTEKQLTQFPALVITRPMDLATLLKRVKSQMYRTKKAFADDLDLIWSNCLAYNSHPVRP